MVNAITFALNAFIALMFMAIFYLLFVPKGSSRYYAPSTEHDRLDFETEENKKRLLLYRNKSRAHNYNEQFNEGDV